MYRRIHWSYLVVKPKQKKMVSYLLVAAAAFFSACMDAFENTPNFNESIFKKWNKKFWCKDISWEFSKKIFGYRFDAWHLSKSFMIVCIALSISLMDKEHSWFVKFVSVGIIWNVVFVLTYHKLFKIK